MGILVLVRSMNFTSGKVELEMAVLDGLGLSSVLNVPCLLTPSQPGRTMPPNFPGSNWRNCRRTCTVLPSSTALTKHSSATAIRSKL